MHVHIYAITFKDPDRGVDLDKVAEDTMAILEVMNKHKLNLTTMVEVELHDVIVWEASRICHAPIS